MARRQKPIASVRPTDRPLTQPGRPVLRRGPQRSVRDAYRTLGNIPILRPQHLQAIHTSVDEDVDGDFESVAVGAREPRVDSGPGSPATSPAQRTPVTIRDLQLPVRSRHSPARNVESMSFTPTDIFEDPEGLESVLSRTPILGTPEEPNIAPASPSSSDVENNDVPINRPAELRGGGDQHKKNQAGHDEPRTPSPSNHVREEAPSRQQQSRPQSPDMEPRAIFLQGYFTDGAEGIPYNFIELSPWPQTEPCRRTGRSSITRSTSASSIPVFPPLPQGLPASNTPREPPWNVASAEMHPPSRQPSVNYFSRRVDSSSTGSNHIPYLSTTATERNAKPRRFGSGTSSASLAYSYYELPDRSSSGGQSQPQFDSNAESRPSTQGTYHSIRASEVRPHHDLLHPSSSRCPGYSSPNMSAIAHSSVSPLPLPPYGRNPLPQTTTQTHNVLGNQVDGSGRDAASTAIQDEPSPLDLLADQLGRLLEGEDSRLTPTLQPFLHQDMVIAEQRTRLGAERQVEQTYIAQQISDLIASSWGNRLHRIEDDPYARGSRAHRQLQQLPVGSSPAYRGRSNPMACNTAQLRSNSQNLSSSPIEARGALSYTGARSHARSLERGNSRCVNLLRLQLYFCPVWIIVLFCISTNRQDCRLPDYHSIASRPPPYRRTEDLIRQLPPVSHEPFVDFGLRARRLEVPPSIHTHQSQPPLRRPFPGLHPQVLPSPPITVPNRRSVRADTQLQNQENSGEAEMELMRLEQEAVSARYDEERQGEVMDETPPRIGRMERFIRDRQGGGGEWGAGTDGSMY
jgi:hypothetical protein